MNLNEYITGVILPLSEMSKLGKKKIRGKK